MTDLHGDRSDEPILDAGLPILDPHHHLWNVSPPALAALQGSDNPFAHVRRTRPRYLLDEFLADTGSGHDVRSTVYVQCHSMYRAAGPEALKPVGEVEFANGQAAMSASGEYGSTVVCQGIVGWADLMLGERVREVLEAQIAVAGGRFRGVRYVSAYDDRLRDFGGGRPRVLEDPGFLAGFAQLAPLGLSFDAWMLEPQLPELVRLARRFPETTIVLDHLGTPLGIGPYQGNRDERFPIWRESVRQLAACDNVYMKLGGLGMPICGFASFRQDPPASSEQLAAEWARYVIEAIELFGAGRCMFESNFPTDSGACSYRTLWNAFKRIASGASRTEKASLFGDVACEVYRLQDV